MLTDEQIRTLNDARTILKSLNPPDSREGGVAYATYDHAEDAIFQALNVTRSYLGQEISDDHMHNREAARPRSLGRADHVEVVGDENGFELHLSTDQGSFVVNIHAVAADFYWQARKEIGGWLNEAEIARRTRPVTDELTDWVREQTGRDDLTVQFNTDAYPADDPKHPDWHSVHADLYDSREGK